MTTFNFNSADYSQYNQEAVKKLIAINQEINEEQNKETVNNEKITKLRFSQLMQGLELFNY